RQVTSNYYDFNTSHISKNNKYKLLANHRRMNARVRETGGVRVTSPDPDENIDLFFADNVQPWISNTNTWELRTHTHIYQEYSLKEFFQVYHRLDREKRQNRFKGPGGIAAIEYYNFLNPALDSLEASDRTKFVTFQNEAGIKGSIWRLFYNGFVKLRSVDFTYNHLRSDTLGINAQRLEFYLGGRGGLQFDKEQYLEAEFEVMQDGNYRVSSVFTTKLLEARAQRSLSKPGFIFLAYRGAHNEWFNNFNDTDYSSLDVRLNLNLPRIKLSPAVNYVDIGNYIFMRETPVGSEQKFLATQSSGRQRILMPSLKFQFEPLKKVFLSGEVIYSNILENADKAIQLPEFFSNVQLAYRHDVEGKGIGYHFGIDVHWRSSYYALSYGTAMQQFYVQESFKVPDFPLVDPFVNLKIKRARIFVRYHNALAALSNSGIMLTPWHPGMPNIADFGVNWMFFD
ncbi:MAG TPA: hypothetical protein PKC24_12605, partial [Cyclobacteriaceae bacterium]|nr:hypothetical protein [Cyclobacteriaceae bacterium]